MNDKKLDDLIRKGLDERTPDLEALVCLRIAAKQFVESRPSAQDAERMGKLEQERDQARADVAKHKAETDRLRIILGKMVALEDAQEKLNKNRADVEREAKAALGQKVSKASTVPLYTDKPIEDWFSGYSHFRNVKP